MPKSGWIGLGELAPVPRNLLENQRGYLRNGLAIETVIELESASMTIPKGPGSGCPEDCLDIGATWYVQVMPQPRGTGGLKPQPSSPHGTYTLEV